MDEKLSLIYLVGVVVLLGAAGIFLLFQIIKTRRSESKFSRLQKKLNQEKGTAKDYYELGSIYLDKKLYVQAAKLMQKALKVSEDIEPENTALIYNALGYAYFAQEQFDLAIRHYKDAIKRYPEYAIALNNLGNAYERKQMITKAIKTYEQTLEFDSKNTVAQRRTEALRKRVIESASN